MSSEANAKNVLHFDEPWDNPVFEAAGRFDKQAWLAGLHSKNGKYANQLRRVRAQVNRFAGYALTKYYPHIGSEAGLSGSDLRILIELQVEAGCNVVALPEPSRGCSVAEFAKNLETYWEFTSRLDTDVALMPYLHLGQDADRFKAKLEIIAEHEHALWCLGLVYASPLTYRPNYERIAEFGHRDLWIHCSGVRRYVSPQRPVSQLHSVQFFGVDSVAWGIPRPAPSAFAEGEGRSAPAPPPPPPSPASVRYFSRSGLDYPRMGDLCDGGKQLPCGCPACKSSTLEDTLAEFASLGSGDDLETQARAFAKVHDVYASMAEFDVARTEIAEDRLTKYYRAKPAMKAFLSL